LFELSSEEVADLVFCVRPARLAMLCFAALLGLMIFVSAFAGIYGVLTSDIYFWWRGLPAAILVAIVSIFLFVDVVLGEI
jgi:hypothetical protein